MNEFSNVRVSHLKLKVMYKNTQFEDSRKKKSYGQLFHIRQKLSYIGQNQSSLPVICRIDSFSPGDLTWEGGLALRSDANLDTQSSDV